MTVQLTLQGHQLPFMLIVGMETTVKVPEAEQAKARGMQVEAYVEDNLAQRAAAQFRRNTCVA